MKKAQDKTRYFRKDYAPARVAAQRSRQANRKQTRKTTSSAASSATVSSHSSKTNKPLKTATAKARQLAAKASTSTKRIAKNISSRTAKAQQYARAKSAQHRIDAKKPRQPLTWSERTLLSLIGISATMIALTLILTAIFDPVARSERELEKLANAYYIEYLYPRSLGKYLDQPETILADYTNRGLPNVRLRQLLLYNNGQFSDSIDAFSNEYYECDTNKTYVRYYPVAPYGPRDFTVYYGTFCEKLVGDE